MRQGQPMSRAWKRIPGRGTSTAEDPARETAWGVTAPRRLGRGELREVQRKLAGVAGRVGGSSVWPPGLALSC